VENSLAPGRIRDQRILSDLEVDKPPVGVPVGQALPDVLFYGALVVFALLEPPETLGARGHVLDHRLVGEMLVAVDYYLADGDPLPLIDVENQPSLARLGSELHHLDLRRVVALVLVQRIDGGTSLFDRVPVERPAFAQVNPAFDLPFAQPVHPPNGPFLQHRPLFDLDQEREPVALVPLLDQHVVELTGPEQSSDGPLNVAVVDRLVHYQAGAAYDLGRGKTLVALDHYAVDRRRPLHLSREYRPTS